MKKETIDLNGKKILITGGTGSLGQALTRYLLTFNVDTIRIFSRNEHKQIEMEDQFKDKRLRFFLGDVRDPERLVQAFEDVDYVFHTAALKHVPKIEYNPFEAIKTNVIGSQNVIDACLKNNVEKAVCIGTDKSVSPLNTYGATKLLMEKLFVTANNYLNKQKYETKFLAVRYGNVLGSSGSVVPKFIEQIRKKQKITITDPNMTRFSINMDDALDFILNATHSGQGSEIFVPRMKAYKIKDLADAILELLENTGHEIIGIREGEKLHEILINEDEVRYGWEFHNMYMIIDPHYQLFHNKKITESYVGAEKIKNFGTYSSANADHFTKQELKQLILKSGLINFK